MLWDEIFCNLFFFGFKLHNFFYLIILLVTIVDFIIIIADIRLLAVNLNCNVIGPLAVLSLLYPILTYYN